MDKLKKYLLSMSIRDRESLAQRCGTTWAALRNISYGYRKPNARLCVAIEAETSGAVRRQDLLPDDWHEIWPELAVNAPSQPQHPPHPSTDSTN